MVYPFFLGVENISIVGLVLDTIYAYKDSIITVNRPMNDALVNANNDPTSDH